MKIAAIDIGSNALRLVIKDTECGDFLANLDSVRDGDYYERVPLKSGMDVFACNNILPPTKIRLALSLKHFAEKMHDCGVSHYRAVATSAYRDAENGQEVISAANEMSGLRTEIISGEEEARLTRLSFITPRQMKDDYFLFADVGGGSTELSLLHKGQLLYGHSFQVGSMRYRCDNQDPAEEHALDKKVGEIHRDYAPIRYIGIGGCVKFMSKYLNREKRNKGDGAMGNIINVCDMEHIYADLQTKTVAQIVTAYGLPEERADILTPASSIFLRIAHGLDAQTIAVPAIGVKNGILAELYNEKTS